MMTSSDGWTPLGEPQQSQAASDAPRARSSGLGNGLRLTPFTRLARVHALSAIGDGLVTVALAGSIFFSIDPSQARWRVALYLILTIAPFAVVTPLLGPFIDRAKGGRRGMVIGTLAARTVVAFFMIGHLDSFLLFPEAFLMLVLQKGYAVSRTALVPSVCPHHEELIEANSKLALLSAIGGLGGAGVGALLMLLFGGGGATGLAVVVFLAGAVLALRLPQSQIAPEPVDITEKLEVRGANIVLAATAAAVMRSAVGFTTFLLAFHLRAGEDGIDQTEPGSAVGAALGTLRGVDVDGTPGPPSWNFAVVALAAGSGALLGARYAPQLRQRFSEEPTTITAFLGAWGGGITGTALLAFGVGMSAALVKLGFDALVQRDAPHSNYGRTFAKFEGRFQLTWALGAFVPVVVPIGIEVGALMVALGVGFAAASYELGRRTDRVQRSRRVRDVIRERVPDRAVERLGRSPAIEKMRPLLERAKRLGGRKSDAGAAGAVVDPTMVAPRPTPPDASVPVDEVDWRQEHDPQLSSGEGVWVSPPTPTNDPTDPTVDMPADPPTDPSDTSGDGQFKLWRDD